MTTPTFQALCEGAVQGERLRVLLRHQENIPLSKADADILAHGLGTSGEHIESMRRHLLKIAFLTLSPEEFEALPEAIKEQTNEGGSKP